MAGDEVERAIGPVARDFGRRQRPTGRVLGEFGGVGAFVLGRAAPEPERHVGAVGLRVVADEEVRTELRGRQIEAAADGVVPDRDGKQHDREPRDEQRRRKMVRLKRRDRGRLSRSRAPVASPRMTMTTNTSAFSRVRLSPPIARPSAQPSATAARLVDETGDQPERQREEEQIEHRLLNQCVEEDRRRVDRQRESRQQPDARREESIARQAEQRARSRTDDRLNDPYGDQAVAEQPCRARQEVRIERRLIEDVRADPLAAGDTPRPLVVAVRVAEQHVEERRTAEQPDMSQTDGAARRERSRRPERMNGASGRGRRSTGTGDKG